MNCKSEICWDYWGAPHQPRKLREECAAVYIFAMANPVENGFPAERVLKVGKAGSKSNARFQSQHYGFSAPSTVSKAITYNPIIWPLLDFDKNEFETTGTWLKNRTHRWNFYLQHDDLSLLGMFEIYLKAVLGPALEGVNTKEKL